MGIKKRNEVRKMSKLQRRSIAEKKDSFSFSEGSLERKRNRKIHKKMGKQLGYVLWNIFTWGLVLTVVLAAVALVGVRVIGCTPYSILSPSMSPNYNVGDLIYVAAANPDEIQVGDVITFVVDENLTVVTHRVDEVDRENRLFYTKGDANESRDGSPVLYENVLGVAVFSLPKLGYVSAYLTSQSGRYVGMAVLLVLILLFILPDMLKFKRKKQDGH